MVSPTPVTQVKLNGSSVSDVVGCELTLTVGQLARRTGRVVLAYTEDTWTEVNTNTVDTVEIIAGYNVLGTDETQTLAVMYATDWELDLPSGTITGTLVDGSYVLQDAITEVANQALGNLHTWLQARFRQYLNDNTYTVVNSATGTPATTVTVPMLSTLADLAETACASVSASQAVVCVAHPTIAKRFDIVDEATDTSGTVDDTLDTAELYTVTRTRERARSCNAVWATFVDPSTGARGNNGNAKLTASGHPFRYDGPAGRVWRVVDIPGSGTATQASYRAAGLLIRQMGLEAGVRITGPARWWLEPDDLVRIIAPDTDDTTERVHTVTYDLREATMDLRTYHPAELT